MGNQFRVKPDQRIVIDGIGYLVAPHPALARAPYQQAGGRAYVTQLIEETTNRRFALKTFYPDFRKPEIVTSAVSLMRFVDLPGMEAGTRKVITPETHSELIEQYPELKYAVLMPWMDGVTWHDVITSGAPLSPIESLAVARNTANVLATLEGHGLAHCDVAGANVVISRDTTRVSLVDLEEMYAPDLPPPKPMPGGQAGYQHKESKQGQWGFHADRFAGAILLSETLCWQCKQVRDESDDEHFFAVHELQDPKHRKYYLIYEVLRHDYNQDVADQFEQAWKSASFTDCPPLSVWATVIGQLAPAARTTSLNVPEQTLRRWHYVPRQTFELPQLAKHVEITVEAGELEKTLNSLLSDIGGFWNNQPQSTQIGMIVAAVGVMGALLCSCLALILLLGE